MDGDEFIDIVMIKRIVSHLELQSASFAGLQVKLYQVGLPHHL